MMKIKQLRDFLKNFPDDLEINFVKYPSHKPICFWDFHEWYICKKIYKNGGPRDEEFLAIMIEDD